MNTPLYTPGEMVRMELLAYENSEGLHPVEEAWRDLCRKLIQHTQEMQDVVVKVKPQLRFTPEELKDWKPFIFPKQFSPVNKII